MNDRLPLVSVITVVFNNVNEIEKTILSVLSQTYPNIEYIIIDGGSTDGTLEVIEKYSSRISKWISEADKGIFDAMNKGIKMASGEWVHFRNSGDLFFASDSVSKIMQNVSEETIILHGNIRISDSDGYRDLIPRIIDPHCDFKLMPIFHPSTFIRRDYHLSHLFDPGFKTSADYHLVLNAVLDKVVFEYKDVPVSIMDVSHGSTSYLNFLQVSLEDVQVRNLFFKYSKGQVVLEYVKVYLTYFFLRIKYLIKNIIPKKYVDNFRRRKKQKQGWMV